MQPASELSVIPHLHVDPLIQTEPDEIEGLLNGICRLLLKTKPKRSELFTQERPANPSTPQFARRHSETLPQVPVATQKHTVCMAQTSTAAGRQHRTARQSEGTQTWHQASKQASKEASKQGSKQATRPPSPQAPAASPRCQGGRGDAARPN